MKTVFLQCESYSVFLIHIETWKLLNIVDMSFQIQLAISGNNSNKE